MPVASIPGGIRRTAAVAAAGTAAALALSGCGSSAPAKPAPTASASTSPAPSPSTDAATAADAQILAAYRGYRQVEVQMFATGTGSATAQAKYSNGNALAQDLKALLDYQKAGVIFTGQPKLAPKVTEVDLAAKPPQATITDCFDATNWKPVYKSTGQSALTPGQSLRYVEVITAQVLDGSWKITNVDLQKDRPC